MIEVSDMWIAAYVSASGVKLLGTKRGEDGWLTFLFDQPAVQAISRWNQGKAVIDARNYRSVVRKFRDAVHHA